MKHRRGKELFEWMERLQHGGEGVPYYKQEEASEVVQSCIFHGYDEPVDLEVMYEALEKAEAQGMRVIVVPDDKFLPGGRCEGQCDGWTYHPKLVERNVYTKEEEYWACGGSTGLLPSRVSPSRINWLNDNEVFVFGSNAEGLHMGGAARTAYQRFGAVWGAGEGLFGQSYALPTMEGLRSTTAAVERFIDFAAENEELRFFVTPVGCGIAGYEPKEIAPLFRRAVELDNVYLPLCFWEIIGK